MKTIQFAIISCLTLLFMNTQSSSAAGAVQISYTVTFPEAQAHYADVEMNISGLSQSTLDLKMPVWTPGSYLVREFAKNIESFSAETNGKMLAAPKVTKNCWRINSSGLSNITVKYRVYCFEISVRTSFVDAAHGFLHLPPCVALDLGLLHVLGPY